MPDAYDAFAARVVLASAAQKSLDAQYFIWHGDQVGNLLFEALWKAAERGVRVRLLLDDGGTTGLDAMLATLDAHPNIEVRLYNPFKPSRLARRRLSTASLTTTPRTTTRRSRRGWRLGRAGTCTSSRPTALGSTKSSASSR